MVICKLTAMLTHPGGANANKIPSGVDWCNVDKSGNPTSTCKNDGSLFIAKRKDNDRGWDYFKLKDGIGWTGIHP